jgi:hypothetical protein
MWRQQRLRGLELAALAAAEAECPPSEVSLRRLLTFARYGARIDGDIGRALRALRVLKDRPEAHLAEEVACTPEPDEGPVAERAAPEPATAACTPEPEPTAKPSLAGPPAPISAADPPRPALPNRRERRRLQALERKAQRRAA